MRFVGNRLRVERLVEKGRRESRIGRKGMDTLLVGGSGSGGSGGGWDRRGSIESILSEDDLRSLLKKRERENSTGTDDETTESGGEGDDGVVFSGDDAEREIRAERVDEGTVATPMGLAGADEQT
jgi:hypothetical protein